MIVSVLPVKGIDFGAQTLAGTGSRSPIKRLAAEAGHCWCRGLEG